MCSPLFFLSHTDRPSLGWLDFIKDKKQYMFGKKIPLVNFYLLWSWCSAGGILSAVLTGKRLQLPHDTSQRREKRTACCAELCVSVSGYIQCTFDCRYLNSHEVYLEATPLLVKDTCITQRTKSWWCDRKSRRDHGFGDRRP